MTELEQRLILLAVLRDRWPEDRDTVLDALYMVRRATWAKPLPPTRDHLLPVRMAA